MNKIFTPMLLIGWVCVAPAAAQSPGTTPPSAVAPELSGLGSLEYRVTTAVPRAQRFFNQGLRLLYAFNHPEAVRAFREASRLDPDLAMAYWGEAMALGPNLNAPMSQESGRIAYEAARRAEAASARATAPERELAAAVGLRYAPDGKGDRRALDADYAAAMSKLAARYPNDPDIQVFYADAVMNTMPWDYWEKAGPPKREISGVIAALEARGVETRRPRCGTVSRPRGRARTSRSRPPESSCAGRAARGRPSAALRR